MDLVLTELEGGIGIITLNNRERRNCLSEAMLNGIAHGIQGLTEQGARAVILGQQCS